MQFGSVSTLFGSPFDHTSQFGKGERTAVLGGARIIYDYSVPYLPSNSSSRDRRSDRAFDSRNEDDRSRHEDDRSRNDNNRSRNDNDRSRYDNDRSRHDNGDRNGRLDHDDFIRFITWNDRSEHGHSGHEHGRSDHGHSGHGWDQGDGAGGSAGSSPPPTSGDDPAPTPLPAPILLLGSGLGLVGLITRRRKQQATAAA